MTWHPGDRVLVRGDYWLVHQTTAFSDCEALDLKSETSALKRTLLLPFDRPRRPSSRQPAVVSRRRWAREVSSLLGASYPYGGLRFCPRGIRLLAYQLEPALAVLRRGALRLLIADDVGLGKTIEACLIAREIALTTQLARTLIVCPAILRGQWTHELSTHFELEAINADAAWLGGSARELPSDVNPWSLPGIYVASTDFVKRPEALCALENVRWDLLIVDEAHTATPGSDRRAAVHALAIRSRRVALLTATPHSGDSEQFSALCGLGAGPESPPLVVFNRSRAQVVPGHARPRTTVLPVQPTQAEARMHRLLEEYTAAAWLESRRRADPGGELVAAILRKRALSSASSLLLSLNRRSRLLAGHARPPEQIDLPLENDEPLEGDGAPDAALAGPALDRAENERAHLDAVMSAAGSARECESKVGALLRMLRRAREPAIVFTEYRDTAEHLRSALAAAGHPVCILHGGLSQRDRADVVAAFNSGGLLLVATDAASEGLNLHHACRLVVHFELPWTPSRLRQRGGRVNRIGQTRRVHEIALVADHTCEQLVLVPLLQRVLGAGEFGAASLLDQLPESRVAAHVLGGVPVEDAPKVPQRRANRLEQLDLREEAQQEVARLEQLRRLSRADGRARRARTRPLLPIARASRRWPGLNAPIVLVVALSLRDGTGRSVEHWPLVLSLPFGPGSRPRPDAEVRRRVQSAIENARASIAEIAGRAGRARFQRIRPLWREAASALARRNKEMRHAIASTARELVQAGLFDRRALKAAAAGRRTREMLLDGLPAHLDEPPAGVEDCVVSFEIRAVLVEGGR